ncbi:MAG: hypothetical protein AB1445_11225 [Bacillota bacterium]
MWLFGVLATFVILVWLVIMGLVHMSTRYHHSRLSRRVLAVEAVFSWMLAAVYVQGHLPLPPAWSVLASLPVALILYVALGVTTLELWRLKLQGSFDDQISRLEQKEGALLQELDLIRDQVHAEALRLRESEAQERTARDRCGRLRHIVNQWQQEPGVARVRSLRVAEWEELYRAAGPGGREARQKELLAEGDAARAARDFEREVQVNVELAIIELVALEQDRGIEVGSKGAGRVDRLLARQDEIASELASVRHELAGWRRKKGDFLSQGIKL